MDSLQSLISAQAPMLDDLDRPEAIVYAPTVVPQEDVDLSGGVEAATDRAIFAEMLTGG